MRGHIKLFMLQMDLERASAAKNAAMAEESVCFGTCRDAASSMKRIFLQLLRRLISGR